MLFCTPLPIDAGAPTIASISENRIMELLHGRPPMNTLGMQNEPRSLPWDEVPQPLHINKRSASNDKRGYRNTTAPRSRCSSSESNVTDASINSIPEPPGGEKPLKVLKRRGDQSNQMRNGDGAYNSSQEQFTNANGEMASPDLFHLHPAYTKKTDYQYRQRFHPDRITDHDDPAHATTHMAHYLEGWLRADLSWMRVQIIRIHGREQVCFHHLHLMSHD